MPKCTDKHDSGRESYPSAMPDDGHRNACPNANHNADGLDHDVVHGPQRVLEAPKQCLRSRPILPIIFLSLFASHQPPSPIFRLDGIFSPIFRPRYLLFMIKYASGVPCVSNVASQN
jgi:hypothetical protein